MIRSKPHRLRWISLVTIALTVAIGSGPKTARAQAASHPTTPPRPIYRTYVQRQRLARPVQPIRPIGPRPVAVWHMELAQRRAMPIRRPVIRQFPRSTQARTYVAPRAFTPHSIVRPEWRGLGPRGYFNSYLFGGAFVSDFGYGQPPANYQMLPLGFGLWPACDSAATPGRFWTIGPCSGIGDYQSVVPSAENEYPPQPYFQTPLEIIEEPAAISQNSPAAPAEKPNMVVSLTSGQSTEVSDWWVTAGRFYFIPVNGKTVSVDLNTLDLQKTIEENEKRGRTFMLNFTPPSERPVLPELPSGPQR